MHHFVCINFQKQNKKKKREKERMKSGKKNKALFFVFGKAFILQSIESKNPKIVFLSVREVISTKFNFYYFNAFLINLNFIGIF